MIIQHFETTGQIDYIPYINYMFSIYPQGNPMLELFWSIIPYEYFYMLMVMPIVVLCFLAMNLPYFIRKAKHRAPSVGKDNL